jgi:hypothetical protein
MDCPGKLLVYFLPVGREAGVERGPHRGRGLRLSSVRQGRLVPARTGRFRSAASLSRLGGVVVR